MPTQAEVSQPPPTAVYLAQAVLAEEMFSEFTWFTATTPERLATGKALYAKNCVGCHGEAGGGDGPGSRYLEEPPTNFTDARVMAGGSCEIYYAKTRRRA